MEKEIVLLGGARTPFGAHGGGLKDLFSADLGVAASRAALERTGVPAAEIDQCIFGNVMQDSPQAIYLARHIALRIGAPEEVPALNVNRLCGSGLQAIISGAQAILLGEARWVLAGGVESMSNIPYYAHIRYGLPLGASPMRDMLMDGLRDSHCDCTMADTTENLVKRYGITRAETDAVALRSQQRAAAAWAAGRFAGEVAPVTIPSRRGDRVVDRDEHMRPQTTLEGLAALRPYFRADGTVTPGNASGIVDGAAAVVVTTAEAARAAGKKPLARLVSWAYVGVDPRHMGIGPAPASRQALARAGLRVEDVGLWEVNEAFAGQVEAVARELGISWDILNVNGGAVALGHPLGASGARLALTLCLEMQRREVRYGVASLCIGGGQGIAAVFERWA